MVVWRNVFFRLWLHCRKVRIVRSSLVQVINIRRLALLSPVSIYRDTTAKKENR